MEIALYQINDERDYSECAHRNYEYAQAQGIDPFAYDRVWKGNIAADDFKTAFLMLNSLIQSGQMFPYDYEGRELLQSDVCEVISENGQSKFYYLDGETDFIEIDFDSSLTREAKEKEITVLACYPGKTAEVITIPNTLKAMQEFVSNGERHSHIEAVYPNTDPIAIICNEEGKLWNFPLNRALYNDEGEMIDAIAGPMFICGLTEDDFCSLRGDLLEKYTENFKHPEQFLQLGDQIIALKIPERQQKENQAQKHHIRR